MKKLIIALLFAALPVFSFGQYEQPDSTVTNTNGKPDAESHAAYLGLGAGFNTYTGLLGISVEPRLGNKFSLVGAMGIGGLGLKLSGGMRFYSKSITKGLFYGLGYSYTGGTDKVALSLDTESPGGTKDVNIKFFPVSDLNLSMGYVWNLGKRARFNLEFGYEVLLTDKVYEVLDSGVTLSETSITALNLSTPGGLLLGFGFTFGL